ncbi:MAG: class I SAM-dependent methyltransferase [Spirochaetia bacterium]|nr:class I SAM-dependent methyltransferase [Spirochaetia bacterium]
MNDYFKKYKIYLPEISDEKKNKLTEYFNILINTAKPLKFIADAEIETLWLRHILDSLVPFQIKSFQQIINKSKYIFDLGTGAGLPGIPLSILYEKNKIYLIESSFNKSIFLKDTISQLNLKNVNIINNPVQNYGIDEIKADLVLFRAFKKPLVSLELSLYVLKNISKVLYWRSKPFFNVEPNFNNHSVNKDDSNTMILERIFNLGFHKNSFFRLSSPGALGERGVYLFEKDSEKSKQFPRSLKKIESDKFINSII